MVNIFWSNCISFLNVSLFIVPVRLAVVDGVKYAGRVEVFYQGKWGKICRNKWDINDAKVVCRQLGFQSALAEFIGMNTRDDTISVAMSDVACTGQESVLASCKRRDGNHQVSWITKELRHCVNLVSGIQQMFRMCALQHYCGAHITLPLEFHSYELSN